MSAELHQDARPWSARRPQNYVLSAALMVIAVFLVRQGLWYIDAGQGGFVPYLIILGGPVMAVYYTWYFCFHRFEDAAD